MERVMRWMVRLEEDLDKQDKVSNKDLKIVKDQFQKHEVR